MQVLTSSPVPYINRGQLISTVLASRATELKIPKGGKREDEKTRNRERERERERERGFGHKRSLREKEGEGDVEKGRQRKGETEKRGEGSEPLMKNVIT